MKKNLAVRNARWRLPDPVQVWRRARPDARKGPATDGGSERREEENKEAGRQDRGLGVRLRGSAISSAVMLAVSLSVPPNLIPCPPSISVSFPSSIPLGDGGMI